MVPALILGGIVVVLIIAFVVMHNGLVNVRMRVKNAWSQIDVQLKRRYDLIPNLVETVKGYAAHEQEVFENVTKARASCMSAQGVGEQAQAENMLSQTLKSLFAVSENYPELKANQNFLALQEELTATENRISFARQHYNDATMAYNAMIERIPTNIIASLSGFKPREFFEIEIAEEREAVKVKF